LRRGRSVGRRLRGRQQDDGKNDESQLPGHWCLPAMYERNARSGPLQTPV
jgi:hypothetical protein